MKHVQPFSILTPSLLAPPAKVIQFEGDFNLNLFTVSKFLFRGENRSIVSHSRNNEHSSGPSASINGGGVLPPPSSPPSLGHFVDDAALSPKD